MITAEITAAIDAAGTVAVYYSADDRYTTQAADTPPNVSFDPGIIDLPSIGLHAFSDGRTGGATRLEVGELGLDNTDGRYDAWLAYSFDGRPFVARSGSTGAYPATFSTVLAGTMDPPNITLDRVTVRLRDKQYKFDLPIRAAALYGGTNALPNGLDGVAADLKGKARPVAYGQVFNVTPPQVNTSRLIFEVGVCNSVDAVYSNGVALVAGAAYVSQVDMETTAPAAGQYRVWAAGGYFRLGSFGNEQVTADVTQGANAAARTVAQIVKALALAAGISAGEISAADVTALDVLNSSVVGIWIDDASMTFLSAMDAIAASVGAWYGFDQTGVMRMGRMSIPSGTPVLSLQEYDVLGDIERRAPKDNGVPVWNALVNYAKNYTVQDSGLAGAVTVARRGFVQQDRRTSSAPDASIKTQWLMSDTMEVDTLLTIEADAITEAARLLALYKVRRDIFDVPIDIDVFTISGARIMDVVQVTYPRFALGAGRLFRLIGIALNDRVATLSLWG